jgi:hypothetical protein
VGGSSVRVHEKRGRQRLRGHAEEGSASRACPPPMRARGPGFHRAPPRFAWHLGPRPRPRHGLPPRQMCAADFEAGAPARCRTKKRGMAAAARVAGERPGRPLPPPLSLPTPTAPLLLPPRVRAPGVRGRSCADAVEKARGLRVFLRRKKMGRFFLVPSRASERLHARGWWSLSSGERDREVGGEFDVLAEERV